MHYNDKTALIVVDVQNDFADRAGSLYVPDGEKVIPFINDEIRGAVEAGAVVVYTQDWHPEETPHFQEFGGIWPVHCVGGTEGAEFHETLDVAEGAMHIRKGTGGEDGYSGFTMRDPETGEETPTGLAGMLRERNVERIYVVGLATDYCVKETVVDGADQGFETTRITNHISSDFLRGFTISLEHDLFEDRILEEGEVIRSFDPHLSQLNLGFSIGSSSGIWRIFRGGNEAGAQEPIPADEADPFAIRSGSDEQTMIPGRAGDAFGPRDTMRRAGQGA